MPTNIDIIRPLARDGLRPAEIALHTGISHNYVCQVVGRLREEGELIPRHKPARVAGGGKYSLFIKDADARQYVRKAAAKRGLTCEQILQQLIDVTIDGRLFDAVLDDRGDA